MQLLADVVIFVPLPSCPVSPWLPISTCPYVPLNSCLNMALCSSDFLSERVPVSPWLPVWTWPCVPLTSCLKITLCPPDFLSEHVLCPNDFQSENGPVTPDFLSENGPVTPDFLSENGPVSHWLPVWKCPLIPPTSCLYLDLRWPEICSRGVKFHNILLITHYFLTKQKLFRWCNLIKRSGMDKQFTSLINFWII